MRLFLLTLFVLLALGCPSSPPPGNSANTTNRNAAANNNNRTSNAVPQYTYEIVKTYPHDPNAFTQGLVVHNGVFYEGTGGRASDSFRSSLRRVEIETGKVQQKFDLAGDYFGEGITIFGDNIYQLTWQEETAFVYDLNTFKLIRELRYKGEGWGLTHDGTNLIMSDGTHVIRYFTPESFEQPVRTLVVSDENGRPVMRLNELEYVKGEIWANVWETGWIVRIDPQTGKVVGRIDLQKLADEVEDKERQSDVLNGIAYDEASDRIFITGKKWSKIYEIKVMPK